MTRAIRFCLAFVLSTACAGGEGGAPPEEPIDEDGLYVEAGWLGDTLTAVLRDRERGTEMARLEIRPDDLYAGWTVAGRPTEELPVPNAEAEAVLRAHTPETITLSLTLLWEATLLPPEPPEGLTFDCEVSFNGCTGVSDTCNDVSVTPACDLHDACYQCGWEQGISRAECDRAFRDNIQGLTGSEACANIYYWGVRILGWMFYQNPEDRPELWGDVYSLGISINACADAGINPNLCTTYLF